MRARAEVGPGTGIRDRSSSKGRGTAVAVLTAAALLVPNLAVTAAATPAPAVPQGASSDSWVLDSTSYQPDDFTEEPFVGNGYIGARLPALGAGWTGGGTVGESNWPLNNHRSTTSVVAGVYQRSGSSDYISTLPTWTDLSFTVDGYVLDPTVRTDAISGFTQSLDMRTGTVTTRFDWTPAAGKTAEVTYTVLANRERMHLAQVRATITPGWSGDLAVTSQLNGAGAQRIEKSTHGVDLATDTSSVTLTTQGRGTGVAMAARLVAGAGVTVADRSAVLPGSDLGTAGETWTVPVSGGSSYEFTKYVGISTSNDQGVPADVALQTVDGAVTAGWETLLAEHTGAWDDLWSHRIVMEDQPALQEAVDSAFYLLYSSLRAGVSFSIPPSGLSSDNYAGVIFWDAETWMYPAILALHPELARSIVQFRYDTIDAARQNAQTAGYQGATWPWDDGPSGLCGGLASCKGYQDHVQSDISLAQWQYFQATGDTQWLRDYGYPVIQGVAQFWASRVTSGSDGKLHINGVSSSDEYAGNKNDDAMTNAGAIVSLRNAVAAAEALGETPDPQWTTVAQNIAVPVDADGSHPEYAGYTNQQTKQASVVLMTYPFGYVTDRATAAADLNRYMPITDTGGPAMTASVEAVVASQVREPGCLDFTRFQDSYLPFLRGSFQQFNETQYLTPSAGQSYPAFSFGTGAGGFLQTLAYGFTGLRWDSSALSLDPTLPRQLAPGMTVKGLEYHGSSVDVSVGATRTTVSLVQGDALDLATPAGRTTLSAGHDVTIDTARPDLAPTDDLARCQAVSASSETAVNRAAAAVDGNTVTSWDAAGTSSTYTVDLGEPTATRHARIVWGSTRPTTYAVEARSGDDWVQVDGGPVAASGELDAIWDDATTDRLRFRFDGGAPASIAELEVVGPDVPDVLTSFDAPTAVTPGSTTRVTVRADSVGGADATGAKAELSVPQGWTASPVHTVPGTLVPGASVSASWDVTAPQTASAAPLTVSATVSWEGPGSARQSRTTAASVYLVPATVAGQTVEAEDMVRAGGAGKGTDHGGYTGSGFVSGLYHGASLTGLVTVPADGTYPVTLRYANSTGGQTAPYVAKTRTISLVVGGQTQQVSLPTGASWDDWVTVTAYATLPAGDDLLQLVVCPGDDGSINLDSLTVGADPVAYLPALSVTAQGVAAGGPVTFRGTGFAPGESVTFSWAGTAVTAPWSATADDDGEVSTTVTVPGGTPDGSYSVSATGDTSASPVTASLYVLAATPSGSVMEAESMLRAGGAGVAHDHAGYTGSGFVSTLYQGASLTGLVTVPTSGIYPVTLRYANSAGGQTPPYVAKTRTVSLVVGGQTQQVSLPIGTSWDDWVTVAVEVPLVAGDDLVRLVVGPNDDGSVNLDSLAFAASPTGQTFTPTLAGPSGPVGPGSRVSVTGAGFVPGETVTLTTEPALVTTTTTANGSGEISASFAVPTTATDGTYELHATGAVSQMPATAPLEVRLVTHATATKISGVAAMVPLGTSVTATVTVTARATGAVEVLDGATSLGTATLNAGSKAVIEVPSLGVGTHTLTARYAGDGTYLASTSASVVVTVTQATQTAVLGAPSRVAEGEKVPVSVGVTPVGATGTVELLDGSVSLGTAALDAGSKAALTVGPLVVGAHHLTVRYLGDGTYLASASAPVTVTVAARVTPPAPVTVSAPVLSKASQAYGSVVARRARLSVTVTGATSGKATFKAAGTTLGSAPVVKVGGVSRATLVLPGTLPVGAYRGLTATVTTGGTTVASVASTAVLKVVKATTKKVEVRAKRFRAGTKPKVTIKVSALSSGQRPVGKIKVWVGKKVVKTVRLKAKRKGRITVTLPKKYAKTIKVRAAFVPKSTKTVKAKKSKVVKAKTKR